MSAFRWPGVLMLVVAGESSGQATPCMRAPASTVRMHLYVEPVKAAPRDSILTAHLCLLPPPAGVGSYAATLTYDSSMMRVTRLEASGGMQVTNATVAGTIRVAGVSPTGFVRGSLAIVTFARARGQSWSNIDLTLSEASAPSGVSLLANARVDGHAFRTPVWGTARLDSIVRRGAALDAEGVTDIVLYGRGFAPFANTVLFDGASIDSVASEAGGSILRFAAPTVIPARGGAAARRVRPGRVEVRVRTPAGTSNAVTFLIRDERS